MLFDKKIILRKIQFLLLFFVFLLPTLVLAQDRQDTKSLQFMCDGYTCSAKDPNVFKGLKCNAGHNEDCTYYACVNNQCVLKPLYQNAITCGNSSPNQSICDTEKEKEKQKTEGLQFMCDGYTCSAKDPKVFQGAKCNAGHNEDCAYYVCVDNQCVLRPLYQEGAVVCGNSSPNQAICDSGNPAKEEQKPKSLQFMCDGYTCSAKDPNVFKGLKCNAGHNEDCTYYVCVNKQCVLRPLYQEGAKSCGASAPNQAICDSEEKEMHYVCVGYTCASRPVSKDTAGMIECSGPYDSAKCADYICLGKTCALRPANTPGKRCGANPDGTGSAPDSAKCADNNWWWGCSGEKCVKKTGVPSVGVNCSSDNDANVADNLKCQSKYICIGYTCALRTADKLTGNEVKCGINNNTKGDSSECTHYICVNKQCVLRPVGDNSGDECAKTGTNGAVPDNLRCAEKVDGKCGILNKGPWNTKPIDGDGGLCSAGDPTTVAGSINGPWSWNCNGRNNGAVDFCSAVKVADTGCGSFSGGKFTSIPTNNLCKDNSVPKVSWDAVAEVWVWVCSDGSRCSAFKISNGVCGNLVYSSKPDNSEANLCENGTHNSAVSGLENGPWTWICFGENGGINKSCTGTKSNVNTPCTFYEYNNWFPSDCVPGSTQHRIEKSRYPVGCIGEPPDAQTDRPCPLTCNLASCNDHATSCNADGTCNCTAGYVGDHCETFPTGNCNQFGNCNNHGNCILGDTCDCNLGWAQPDCRTCATGYIGSDCHFESSTCNTTSCNSHDHGTCSCQCNIVEKSNFFGGFIGSILNNYIDVIKGKLLATTSCTCNCMCETGWDASTQCSTCATGYYPPGSCTTYCNASTCGAHGSCNTNTGACICSGGYTGDYCETEPSVDLCFGVNCGTHGSCSGGTCVCNDGYTGTYCTTPPTSNTICWVNGNPPSINGMCIETLASGTCENSNIWPTMQACCDVMGPLGGDDCTSELKLCYVCSAGDCLATVRMHSSLFCETYGWYNSRFACQTAGCP